MLNCARGELKNNISHMCLHFAVAWNPYLEQSEQFSSLQSEPLYKLRLDFNVKTYHLHFPLSNLSEQNALSS